MDILEVLKSLFQGNNGLLILLAIFLFKDQLLALIGMKPKPDPVPPPVILPAPAPVPVVIQPDHPLIDAFIRLLPVLLPLITKGKEAEEKEKKAEAENSK